MTTNQKLLGTYTKAQLVALVLKTQRTVRRLEKTIAELETREKSLIQHRENENRVQRLGLIADESAVRDMHAEDANYAEQQPAFPWNAAGES